MKWPILDFHLELPLFQMQTALWRRVDHEQVIEYIKVEIRVWKWRGSFRLYDSERPKKSMLCAASSYPILRVKGMSHIEEGDMVKINANGEAEKVEHITLPPFNGEIKR